MSKITGPQQKRLQVLYGQFARHSIGVGADRAARIAWASEQLGHSVASFSELSKDDATRLIDTLQGGLGIAPTKKARRPRRNDQAAGTEGRKAVAAKTVTLATAEDVERIQNALTRLGWSQAQYEGWLRSPRSPLARKVGKDRIAPSDITLRTRFETNRVWWALKGMLVQRGLWKKEGTSQ
jgi:hypothetical protein